MKIDIDGRRIYLEHGESYEMAIRFVCNTDIFPKGSVDIRKLSKDFLREMKNKWKFNNFCKDYIRVEFGQKFYEEIIGKE